LPLNFRWLWKTLPPQNVTSAQSTTVFRKRLKSARPSLQLSLAQIPCSTCSAISYGTLNRSLHVLTYLLSYHVTESLLLGTIDGDTMRRTNERTVYRRSTFCLATTTIDETATLNTPTRATWAAAQFFTVEYTLFNDMPPPTPSREPHLSHSVCRRGAPRRAVRRRWRRRRTDPWLHVLNHNIQIYSPRKRSSTRHKPMESNMSQKKHQEKIFRIGLWNFLFNIRVLKINHTENRSSSSRVINKSVKVAISIKHLLSDYLEFRLNLLSQHNNSYFASTFFQWNIKHRLWA